MDNTREYLLWLDKLYELGVISKIDYVYKLEQLGQRKDWIDSIIRRKLITFHEEL